jgi:hypothetical protein
LFGARVTRISDDGGQITFKIDDVDTPVTLSTSLAERLQRLALEN